MFESISDYEQRIELAQALLRKYNGRPLPPAEKFAIAQDIASLAAPGWEWVIRKWEPKPTVQQIQPKVNGREITFNNVISLAELSAVLIHKTDHLVMGHQDRKGHRDDKLWNVASCLENIKRWQEVFERLAVALPPQIDPSQQIKNLPREEAEKIYDMLDPSAANAPSDGDGDDGDGQGDGNQSGQSKKGDKQQPGQGQPGQGQPGQGQPGQGQPGQGQPGDQQGQGQGQPGQGQGQPGDPSAEGQPGPGQGQGQGGKLSKEEIEDAADCELDEDNFDQTMLDPADGMGQEGDGQEADGQEGDGYGDGQGKKPGKDRGGDHHGDGTADNPHQNDPRAPYVSLIRLVRRRLNLGHNNMNFSLRRPSNRSEQTNGGVLSRLDHAPDSLRVVVDSSGSLSKELLDSIFRAVGDLEKYAKREGTIDRSMYSHGDTVLKTVGNGKKMKTIVSGGGTDMKVVIEQAMKHPKMRDGTAWVIITDGETPTWPARLPKNTVVILVNNNLKTGQKCPDSVGWSYKIPPHVQRVAVCISQDDFIAGGQIIQRPQRHVA